VRGTPVASIWALLAPNDEARFAAVIRRLATAAGSEAFRPHVTLLGEVRGAGVAALQAVATRHRPVPVALDRLVDTPEPFRAVVLAAGDSPPLSRLQEDLAERLGRAGGGFWPHLSLVYGRFDAEQRAALRRQVDLLLPATALLTAVAVVDTSASQVSRWVERGRWPLTG
jgi:2'-5' RNA ligase